MNYLIKVILGFVVLNLYLNVGIAKSTNFFLQVVLVVLFFPLLKIILMMTGLNDLKRVGLTFHEKWWKNIGMGFAIGFLFWLIKYAVEYVFDGFKIVGVQSAQDSFLVVVMILLTFLVGSFLNDLIIRGYVFGHLKSKIPVGWVFLISLLLYAMDDSWNEGFSLSNLLFSLILGLSLTYAIFKTGSIWATTGLHWGLNVCYGVFNGPIGAIDGGIFQTEMLPHSIYVESISYLIPAMMFVVVYLLRKKWYRAP